jgi:hypothetical protein
LDPERKEKRGSTKYASTSLLKREDEEKEAVFILPNKEDPRPTTLVPLLSHRLRVCFHPVPWRSQFAMNWHSSGYFSAYSATRRFY